MIHSRLVTDVVTSGTQTQTRNVETSEMDTMEQTRVAVQALQDIANDIQYVNSSSLPMNTTIQNVTLNSGRMIQVVVQGPPDQVIVGADGVIEAVQQIEIDNSVESIIPVGEQEEIVDSSDIIQNSWSYFGFVPSFCAELTVTWLSVYTLYRLVDSLIELYIVHALSLDLFLHSVHTWLLIEYIIKTLDHVNLEP